MEIIKINRLTKTRFNGGHFYDAIIKIGDKYFYTSSIKATEKPKKTDIHLFKPTREVHPQYYKANGIV